MLEGNVGDEVHRAANTVYSVLKGEPIVEEVDGSRQTFAYFKGVLSATVHRLLSTMGSTFVTKMNKLLFYVDFISYKRCGYGITGLTYRALQFGPMPEDWAKIYSSLQDITLEEYVYSGGQSGIQLKSVS